MEEVGEDLEKDYPNALGPLNQHQQLLHSRYPLAEHRTPICLSRSKTVICSQEFPRNTEAKQDVDSDGNPDLSLRGYCRLRDQFTWNSGQPANVQWVVSAWLGGSKAAYSKCGQTFQVCL